MGCSLSDTVVAAGTELRLHYRHHLETNYCIGGEGEVEDLATGQVFPIRSGTVYALDKNDAHVVRATKGELRLVWYFVQRWLEPKHIKPTVVTPPQIRVRRQAGELVGEGRMRNAVSNTAARGGCAPRRKASTLA